MAESLIYDLCKAVASKLKEEGFRLSGVPEEAKKMERNLEAIKAVLKAAEQRELDDGVKQWIRDLKDVAYDIEDVLDDWSIAQLQMQDQAGTSQRGNMSIPQGFFSCIPSSPCFCFKQPKSRHGIAHAIIEINKRLDDIDERKKKFTFPTAITSSIEKPQRDATTSYGYYADVDSQKYFKAEVIKKLVDIDFKGTVVDRIPIISIVGMGGLGKTTVARLVYGDETVNNHFSQKIAWVCVSNNFDEMKVAKDIARNLCQISADESDLQCGLTQIENYIRGTKFLLVLDDVWEESEIKWNPILKCLSKGDTQGSRILMTSRNQNFSRKMVAEIVPMNKLSEAEAMSLFSYYAFPGDPDHRGEVEDIAVQLVEKCDGLPLALQVLGSHMVTKTTRSEWHDVLSSKMWKMKFQEKVFNSLAFSYIELPSQAKRCFAFCSVFGKDTVMEKNELIRLWMAQGYLEGTDQMEALGNVCFESLLRRSFFQASKPYSDKGAVIRVTMHDLVHDFAQYISYDDAAILDPSNLTKGSAHLRHLAFTRQISESECPLSSLNCSALRTLFVQTHKLAAVLDELCSNKSYIRALSMGIYPISGTLDGYDIKDIGKLKHLRYLQLSSMKFIVLPEEIYRLPYLQTLDVRHWLFAKLPKDIGRLTTLRHLLFSDERMNSLPKGLGKLSSLQTLSAFIFGGLVNEDCSSLEDLRDLNNLRGDLTLRNLNSVVNVDEATSVCLSKKTHIHQLKLHFGEGDASLQSEVLKALQPAKENLVFLKIRDYRGKLCPPWTGQMQYLKKVELEQVGMDSLAELGTLRSLKYLFVKEANEVRHVGAEIFGKVKEGQSFFPKLESLIFENMANWEHWDGPKEKMGCGVTLMPSLRILQMYECKALRTLPRFLEHVPLASFSLDSRRLPPTDLAEDGYPKRWRIGDILLPQTLKIMWTPYIMLRQKEAPFHPEASSQVVQQQHLNLICVEIDSNFRLCTVLASGRIMDFAYLRKVRLSQLEDLWLPPLGSLTYLEALTIHKAEKVEKVGDEFLGISSSNNNNDGDHGGRGASTTPFIAFPKLRNLSFECMPAWREWEDPVHGNNLIIMPSLCDLKIKGCEMLKSIPHFFEALVSLKTLRVGATEEGNLPKIRNTANTGVDDAAYEMSKARSTTTTLAKLELREITLYAVKNEWIHEWAKYCVRLRFLWLRHCVEASYVGQLEVSLPSLETIKVIECDFRRLGMEMLWISSLKELYFVCMPKWEEWDDAPPHQPEIISNESRELSQHGNNTNFTSNLRVLYLKGCPKLKALPSFLRSVCTLEELHITNCGALKTWWEIVAGEDWRKWISTIPTVHFEPFFKKGEWRYYRFW